MPTIHGCFGIATVIGVLAGLLVPLGPAEQPLPRILLGFILGGVTFAVPLLVHLLGPAPSAPRARRGGGRLALRPPDGCAAPCPDIAASVNLVAGLGARVG